MVHKTTWMLALALLMAVGTGQGQTVRLVQSGTQANRIGVQVGAIVQIDVFADLQGTSAAGVALFLSVPDNAFEVIDTDTVSVGKQPFTIGPLFQGATVSSNLLLPETDPAASNFDGQQLEYSSVLGIGSDRQRTGSGVIVRFSLRCVQPIENGVIRIDDNAARETKLVLSDGVSERRFRTVQGMEITVTGLEIRDIPDVFLLPDQSDSTQIGTLDQYLLNALSPADSIRWTFQGDNLDSLEILVDPNTRRVKITPLEGWSGRRRIIWRAEEAVSLLPGELPLFRTEISTIVVNNPPRFTIERSPDGIKRDTVRIVEDEHTFFPALDTQDPRRAFRGRDLDFIVEDPDINDPEAELRFAVLGFGPRSVVDNVRGEDDEDTHELLVWSAPDFAGVDSLNVLVSDGLLGGLDTLRVIVEVAEVPDAPRFILEDPNLRISRGGSKTLVLQEVVEDPDTPLDSLILTFEDDPAGNFTVELEDNLITVRGKDDFAGQGFLIFRAADPADPDNLNDRLQVFVTAAEALPPGIFPNDLKITLTPPGFEPALPPFVATLDNFVEDPDHQDSDLNWSVPSLTRSNISVDDDRVLTVSAPAGFVGFEPATLTVTDPGNQSDFLGLRIYSSAGEPVTGGIPDVILDRGESDSFDLDEYYFDANNDDLDMRWEMQVAGGNFAGNFQSEDLQIGIDPLTHIVDFLALPSASFRTETVIFRVTSTQEGISAQDTILVTIRTGDDPGGGGGLDLRPLPPLQAPVGVFAEVFDLDDLVPQDVDPDSISWSVTRNASFGEVFISATNRVVRALGDTTGLDTLEFTARDNRGNIRVLGTTLRWFDARLAMDINAIPDIAFIAGTQFDGLRLDDFIADRVTNPDSLVRWERQFVGPDDKIFVRINPDETVFAFAAAGDISETEVVFIATNTETGLTGRDTVRVIALDPALAVQPLKDLPTIIIVAGKTDSSVVLNEFLPDEVNPSQVSWDVSGQSITLPFIEPEPPHRLRLSGVGGSVGTDTLTLRANLGGGFSAVGRMAVTVVEPVDAQTLDLRLVPNPFQNEYIDVFVVARRAIAGTPIVVRNFGGVDSTVSIRQSEEDLDGRGVLIWEGNFQLRPRDSGLVSFTAQAFTALGTNVNDTASVAVVQGIAGKALALDHKAARLELPAGALPRSVHVLMQVEKPDPPSLTHPEDELEAVADIDLYPAGLRLQRPGRLAMDRAGEQGLGLYRRSQGRWVFSGPAAGAPVARLGRYRLARDLQPPRIEAAVLASGVWRFALRDGGSGIGGDSIQLTVDGLAVTGQYQDGHLQWTVPAELAYGEHRLELRLADRAGNTAAWARSAVFGARGVPLVSSLGANYPNPFNPGTTIPYTVGVGGGEVRLGVYNVAGQRVRLLMAGPVAAGHYRVDWDGRDDRGGPVASGMYLYRFETPTGAWVRRMTLLK